jgi:hypothetical protein
MTSFTGYWLTRGRPHYLARWLSSSFSPLAGRAVSPVLLVAGLEHVMRQQPYSSSLPTPTERWMPMRSTVRYKCKLDVPVSRWTVGH